MRKRIILILSLVCTTAIADKGDMFTAVTDEGVIMTFTVLDETKGTCSVYKTTERHETYGTNEYTYHDPAPAIDPSTTGTVTIPVWAGDYKVTEIGEEAFGDCKGLTGIILPETIHTIHEKAFRDCTGLTSVEFPEDMYEVGGFEGCIGLTSVTIPESARVIGKNAFADCKNLAVVNIPNGFGFGGNWIADGGYPYQDVSGLINEGAFACCSALREIKMSKYVYGIYEKAFYGCINLEKAELNEGLVDIFGGAFSYCTKLKEVNIPSTVARTSKWSNPDNPFTECWSLERINVAEGNNTFDSRDNCNAIIYTMWNYVISACNSTVLPEGVTAIWHSAFSGCRGLKSLHIPSTLTNVIQVNADYSYTIDTYDSFQHLGNELESITVAAGNPRFSSPLGSNALMETSTGRLLLGCKNTVVPTSATAIGKGAFMRCMGLTTIDIPSNVKVIEDYAFRGSGLQTVSFHEGLKKIEHDAFEGCVDLQSVSLPQGLDTIRHNALADCFGLKSLFIPKSATGVGISGEYWERKQNSLLGACPYLESIIVEEGNPVYDSREGCNALIRKAASSGENDMIIHGCKNTVIPKSVTAIGNGAFSSAFLDMTEINIPKQIKSIGGGAFSTSNVEKISVSALNTNYDSRSNCNAIISGNTLLFGCKNTVIPSNITTIGSNAFAWVPFESITIPANITEIKSGAFYCCFHLKSVTSLIEEPFKISLPFYGYYDFMYGDLSLEQYVASMTLEKYNYSEPVVYRDSHVNLVRDMTLYVPKGTKEKYMATEGWNKFKLILEIGEELPTTIEEHQIDAPKGNGYSEWYTIDGRKQQYKPAKRSISIVRQSDGNVQKVVTGSR